jgi:hypothetical protein
MNNATFSKNLEYYKAQNYNNALLLCQGVFNKRYIDCLKKIYNNFQELDPEHMLFAPVRNIKICKRLIEPTTEFKCNLLTLGRYKEAINTYGPRYHTYAVIETLEGKYTLEKDYTNVILLPYTYEIKIENMSIPIENTNICMFSLLCNLVDNYIEPEKMYEYNIRTDNCQHYMIKFLKSNNLDNLEIVKFISQQDNDNFCDKLGLFEDIFKLKSFINIISKL